MFLPDKSSRWQIVVQDQMGHRLALECEVSGEKASFKASETREAVSPKVSRPEGIIAGLGIIFGLSGFLYGWKARFR